jgi:hypothetical protein
MIYTLIIGELDRIIEGEGLDIRIVITAKGEEHKDAPAFGEPTDHSNSRWPSYSSWAESMRFVGLYNLMFNEETGLIRNRPGNVYLTQEHKKIVDRAYASFYRKYPNCKAGYSPKINIKEGIFQDPEWPKENVYATRIEWLKYWVDWSLENCEHPIFCNS